MKKVTRQQLIRRIQKEIEYWDIEEIEAAAMKEELQDLLGRIKGASKIRPSLLREFYEFFPEGG